MVEILIGSGSILLCGLAIGIWRRVKLRALDDRRLAAYRSGKPVVVPVPWQFRPAQRQGGRWMEPTPLAAENMGRLRFNDMAELVCRRGAPNEGVGRWPSQLGGVDDFGARLAASLVADLPDGCLVFDLASQFGGKVTVMLTARDWEIVRESIN